MSGRVDWLQELRVELEVAGVDPYVIEHAVELAKTHGDACRNDALEDIPLELLDDQ